MNIVAPLQERRDFNSMVVVKDDLSKENKEMLKSTSTATTTDALTEEMGPDENV